MLVSLFSPSHDPRWLGNAYRSIRDQTHADYEWVIVLNGAASRDAGALPDDLRRDERVRVLVAPQFADCGRIGALKRFAASQCKGDVLVELDHDDTLAPTALARIAWAVDQGAGFIYSDFVQLRPDGACATFPTAMGWESYHARIDGREYEACRAFPISAASLVHIWWAPNHVRAWTRDAYDRAGGHDAELKVCDDYDLLCRTYLAGIECAYIPEPLYFYHLRKGAARNSYLEHNAEIQRRDQQLSNRYFYQLCDEWCRREALERAILERSGEFFQLNSQNALQRIGFTPGTVGVIRAHDLFHQLKPDSVVTALNECYRALVPGGWLQIRVPSTRSQLAFSDPAAQSYWNRTSWWWYTRKPYASRVNGLNVRFQEVRSWEGFATEWDVQQRQFSAYADLCALKGQRTPGLQHI